MSARHSHTRVHFATNKLSAFVWRCVEQLEPMFLRIPGEGGTGGHSQNSVNSACIARMALARGERLREDVASSWRGSCVAIVPTCFADAATTARPRGANFAHRVIVSRRTIGVWPMQVGSCV